jgi:hypothetical protein
MSDEVKKLPLLIGGMISVIMFIWFMAVIMVVKQENENRLFAPKCDDIIRYNDGKLVCEIQIEAEDSSIR